MEEQKYLDTATETSVTVHEPFESTTSSNELYIQELEERLMSEQRANAEQTQALAMLKQELTQLRNDGILKDRQIRQLNADNAALRARLPERQRVGAKRPRTEI